VRSSTDSFQADMSAAFALAVFAKMMTPEVSRSSRWITAARPLGLRFWMCAVTMS